MGSTTKLIRKVSSSYQYLFYKYSCWDRYNWRKKNISGASWTGLYVLSFLTWIYFLDFLILLEVFTGYGFNNLKYLLKVEMVGIGSIFLFLNYVSLASNKKYKKIFKQFENESKAARIKGNIFASLFIASTFILGFYFMHLLKIFRPGL